MYAAVQQGATQTTDIEILLSLRQETDLSQPHGPQWLLPVVTVLTHLGSGYALTAIAVAGSLLLLRIREKRESLLFGLAFITGIVLLYSVKALVARERPDMLPHLVSIGEYSFPSGHAMMTMLIFPLSAMLFQKRQQSGWKRTAVIFMAFLVSIVIGLTRVYLGVHYPSDVLAGWGAGVALFSAAVLIGASRKRSTKSSPREDQASV